MRNYGASQTLRNCVAVHLISETRRQSALHCLAPLKLAGLCLERWQIGKHCAIRANLVSATPPWNYLTRFKYASLLGKQRGTNKRTHKESAGVLARAGK